MGGSQQSDWGDFVGSILGDIRGENFEKIQFERPPPILQLDTEKYLARTAKMNN